MEDIYVAFDGEVISKLAFTRRMNKAIKQHNELWGYVSEFIGADGNRYHILKDY